MTCFFSKKKHCFFFKKKLGKKKHMLFIVDKTKQKLLFQNYECFSKEKKCQELIFAEGIYLGPLWVQVQPVPAWFKSFLKSFVINADSLFAKYGKLTACKSYKSIKQNILFYLPYYRKDLLRDSMAQLVKAPTSDAINR